MFGVVFDNFSIYSMTGKEKPPVGHTHAAGGAQVMFRYKKYKYSGDHFMPSSRRPWYIVVCFFSRSCTCSAVAGLMQ